MFTEMMMSAGGGGSGELFFDTVLTQNARSGVNSGVKLSDAHGCYGILGNNSYGMYGAYARIENGVLNTLYSSAASISTDANNKIVVKWDNTNPAFNNIDFNVCVW